MRLSRRQKKRCLAGKGPILIEAMTYRMGAHSTSDDPSRYRDDKELKEWEQKCPIKRLRCHLEGVGEWNDKKEKKLQEEIGQEVDEAIALAKKTPKPPLESLVEDVYAHVPDHLQQQLDGLE